MFIYSIEDFVLFVCLVVVGYVLLADCLAERKRNRR